MAMENTKSSIDMDKKLKIVKEDFFPYRYDSKCHEKNGMAYGLKTDESLV
ncbi:hypothetical protein [Pantoea sp. S61]|nr:hypothetical protein [Pantoea sp. S61]